MDVRTVDYTRRTSETRIAGYQARLPDGAVLNVVEEVSSDKRLPPHWWMDQLRKLAGAVEQWVEARETGQAWQTMPGEVRKLRRDLGVQGE